MHSTAWPETVDVGPGETGHISVAITNTSNVIDAYEVQVFGLDPAWVEIEPPRLSLFPGDTESVAINLKLPADYPSSHRTLAVNVLSDDDPGSFALAQVELNVRPLTQTSITLDPVMVTAGRKATFGLVVANAGNAAVTATGFAVDPEELAEFTFEPPRVVVPPGREQVIRVTAQGGRDWFGQPRARTFTLGVDAEERVETIGTFIQRPRIGRWLMSLLGLLTAAAVFAAVLSTTFDRVVDEAKVTDAVLDDALAEGAAGGAQVPTNPGSVTGSLVATTSGQALSGVQAELFLADDTSAPIASAVTDDDGAFTLANLGAGEYKLRLSGAGVDELWYPDARTAADATPFEVELGNPPRALDPIAVGGVPVDVAGTLDLGAAAGGAAAGDGAAGGPGGGAGIDPTDVTLSLVVPGQVDPTGAALVAQVSVAPDGSFVLPDVPTPGNYQLIVEAPGAATETRDLVLEPGAGLGDLEITLRPGDGIISGTITGPFGPLGGATVTATDGSNEVETVSLTDGLVGTFTLRNLATPAQYTVTISRDGFAPEVRTIAVDSGQTIGNFSARLVPADGAIRGRATVLGQPTRGLSVHIAGGDVDRTTTVVSQGVAAGSYSFTGLPAPATYTLTFTGNGTIPQVRVVDLDPATGPQNVTGIDVSLSQERTVVRGLVRDTDGTPEPQATVVLSDGTNTFTFLTADEPLGEFEFGNVLPGAYTLTASRVGTEPVVVLVNVSATEATPAFDLRLGRQAALSGSIAGFDPASRSLVVRLFEPAQFPVGTPTGTVLTDRAGNYVMPPPDGTGTFEIEAPATYVVAVYASDSAADPLDSVVIVTEPSATTAVPTITVSL